MERRDIDPWDWWEQHATMPAIEIKSPSRTVYFSGFPAWVSQDSPPVVVGDARAQLTAALDNVEAALKAADMSLKDVVKLNLYTTDMNGLMAAYDVLAARMRQRGGKVTGCLLGVTALARPDLLVEIEITAVQ